MQEEHNKRRRGESFKTEFSRQAPVSSRLSPVLKHTHRILNVDITTVAQPKYNIK